MMKLKLSQNIFSLVLEIYSGGKSEQFLQCSIIMREISEGEMLQFREAAKQSETIQLEYKKIHNANWLSLNQAEQLNTTMNKGLEYEKTFTKFHEWIVTTLNDYISSVDDLCAK